jgi:molybdenum-dependent DNA-binding transcriptional regulator ModE
MNRSTGTIILAGILGAAAAAALAYLLTSERGRVWLRQLPGATRDLTREGQRLLAAVQQVATEVEQSLEQVQQVVAQVVEAAHSAGTEQSSRPAPGSQPV